LLPAKIIARDAFLTNILNLGGTFRILEEGHTNVAFQNHLLAIRNTYIALNALPGVGSIIVAGRPQLTTAFVHLCQTLIDEVNLEIIIHNLAPFGPDNAPWAHNSADATAALHLTGEAFDIEITGLTEAQINSAATAAGVTRPDPVNQPLHFE
jgi:hypothetical protein